MDSQECKQFAIAPFKLLEFKSLQTQKHILALQQLVKNRK
jgi:hypothetical protein